MNKEIMDLEGAAPRLMNQNSRHKNACIHHEANG